MSLTNNNNELLQGGTLLPLVEDFYTIQGEGHHTGKPAYFIRLGGCDVGCRWCDAKATWNPRLYPPVPISEIVERAVSHPAQAVVITGGEPSQYPLQPLTEALHAKGLQIFLETAGTHPLQGEFDWICLSPKQQQPPLPENLSRAHELKVIIQSEADLRWAEQMAATISPSCLRYLQPEWSRYEEVIPHIVAYAMANPTWQVSLQCHKFMHIP